MAQHSSPAAWLAVLVITAAICSVVRGATDASTTTTLPSDYPWEAATSPTPAPSNQSTTKHTVIVSPEATSPVPGTALGVQFISPNRTCWFICQEYPSRVCSLFQTNCQASNISDGGSCTFCNKGGRDRVSKSPHKPHKRCLTLTPTFRCAGWGVYATQDQCMNQTSADGGFVGAGVDRIDANSYPPPYAPGNWCPSRRQPNWGKSAQDACPHNWPDLKL
jgi:hypothetical protein